MLPKVPNNSGWNVQASTGAINTTNPIREIIETMNLAENPNKNVIPLSIGDPTIFGNLKPCKEILDALQKANTCGKFYGYQTAAGMEAARDAVARYHNKNTGNNVKRQDVILASGCSHAIDLSICVLARQGQNILIPRPGFPLYKTLTSVYGIQYKQYDLVADKNWSIDLQHLESLIDENTAAIVINNPSNPCGSVFSREHLLQILELAERYKKPIIADEIYDKFVFPSQLYQDQSTTPMDGVITTNNRSSPINIKQDNGSNRYNAENRQPTKLIEDEICNNHYGNSLLGSNNVSEQQHSMNSDSIMAMANNGHDDHLDEMSHVPFISLSSLSDTVPILTCGGISKTCLIPGLRLGWIIINDKRGIFDASVRNGLNRLTQRLMGPNSLVQGALNDILTTVPESFYAQTMHFMLRNAKLCYEKLKSIKGIQPYMPQGSMYLMAKFDPKLYPDIEGDVDFTSKLMNEESVLVLPGRCFDFPNYFRICLTVPTNVMDDALTRIREFCERHYIDQPIFMESPVPSIKSASYSSQSDLHLLKLNLGTTSTIKCQQASKCK